MKEAQQAEGLLNVVPGPVSYNNIIFGGNQDGANLTGGTMIVDGLLSFEDSSASGGTVNSGTILAYGDVEFSQYGKTGTALLRLVGSTNQTVTSVGTVARLVPLEIASTGGTVTFVGIHNLFHNWTYTSGAVDMGTSTLLIVNTGIIITPGPVNYYNVTFAGAQDSASLNSGTMIVNGLLKFADTSTSGGSVNTGTILAYGNVEFSDYGKTGTAVVRLAGSASQTVTGVGTLARVPVLEIASTGGIVSFVGYLNIYENWTYTSGTVDMGTSTLNYTNNNIVITPGPVEYYNVIFGGAQETNSLNSGTMIVKGTLTLNDTSTSLGYINSGTILAYGNIVSNGYGKLGSATIRVVGSASQSITGSANGNFPNFEIASTGGIVSLASTLRFRQTFTYTSGTVDAGTSSVEFIGPSNSTTQLYPNNITLYNVNFSGSYVTYDLNAQTMTVNGTLTLSDTSTSLGSLVNGTVVALGNISSISYGKIGSALIKVAGSTNQTYTSVSTAYTPKFEIASTGGIFTFVGSFLFRDDFTYTSGAVDTGTSTLRFSSTGLGTTRSLTMGSFDYNNIEFIGANTSFNLNASTLNVKGTLTFADSNATYGGVNNGTINAYGNLSFTSYGKSGNVVLNIVGSNSVTINETASAVNLGSTWQINKTGGATVTLATAFTLGAVTPGINVIDGDILMSGFALNVNGSVSLNGNSITKSGGVLTVGGVVQGTGSLLGGTVNP